MLLWMNTHFIDYSEKALCFMFPFFQERTKEHFLKFVICQKYTNEARNLEQNLSNIRLHIDKRIQKLFSQKNADLQVAR